MKAIMTATLCNGKIKLGDFVSLNYDPCCTNPKFAGPEFSKVTKLEQFGRVVMVTTEQALHGAGISQVRASHLKVYATAAELAVAYMAGVVAGRQGEQMDARMAEKYPDNYPQGYAAGRKEAGLDTATETKEETDVETDVEKQAPQFNIPALSVSDDTTANLWTAWKRENDTMYSSIITVPGPSKAEAVATVKEQLGRPGRDWYLDKWTATGCVILPDGFDPNAEGNVARGSILKAAAGHTPNHMERQYVAAAFKEHTGGTLVWDFDGNLVAGPCNTWAEVGEVILVAEGPGAGKTPAAELAEGLTAAGWECGEVKDTADNSQAFTVAYAGEPERFVVVVIEAEDAVVVMDAQVPATECELGRFTVRGGTPYHVAAAMTAGAAKFPPMAGGQEGDEDLRGPVPMGFDSWAQHDAPVEADEQAARDARGDGLVEQEGAEAGALPADLWACGNKDTCITGAQATILARRAAVYYRENGEMSACPSDVLFALAAWYVYQVAECGGFCNWDAEKVEGQRGATVRAYSWEVVLTAAGALDGDSAAVWNPQGTDNLAPAGYNLAPIKRAAWGLFAHIDGKAYPVRLANFLEQQQHAVTWTITGELIPTPQELGLKAPTYALGVTVAHLRQAQREYAVIRSVTGGRTVYTVVFWHAPNGGARYCAFQAPDLVDAVVAMDLFGLLTGQFAYTRQPGATITPEMAGERAKAKTLAEIAKAMELVATYAVPSTARKAMEHVVGMLNLATALRFIDDTEAVKLVNQAADNLNYHRKDGGHDQGARGKLDDGVLKIVGKLPSEHWDAWVDNVLAFGQAEADRLAKVAPASIEKDVARLHREFDQTVTNACYAVAGDRLTAGHVEKIQRHLWASVRPIVETAARAEAAKK